MPRVLVTREIADKALDRMRNEGIDLHIHKGDSGIDRTELLELIPEFDGLLCLLTDRIDAEVLNRGRKLKAVCNYAAGYNNIDIETAEKAGIRVCTTPGVLSEATADLAWALLLATARHIPAGDGMVRRGEFRGWEPGLLLGRPVQGRTLGIVGAGRIGTATALRSRGFDMKVLYTRSQNRVLDDVLKAELVSLDDLLRRSDFISIHTPLTEKTHHLIGHRELNLMKKDAILINTGRGQVIDENALVDALRQGRIAGAGLDVFEREPELAEGLAGLPNVVLSPHTGSATRETRENMAMMSAEDMIRCLSGREPLYAVEL